MSHRSPGKMHTITASPYSSSHQTPVSYHQTAMTRSPFSPYNHSPITGTFVSSSAGNSASASPAGINCPLPHQSSPSIILQQITLSQATKPNPWPQIHRPRRQTPVRLLRTWRLRDGAKGYTGRPKGGEPAARKGSTSRNDGGDDDDDKIPDVVWERMIKRILSYVGVPLVIGFALLKGFDVVIEKGMWKVPLWLPFLTTLITFGTSALGIAYGSLSTSLNEAEEGSLLGFEQVQKNWVEMWKED